MARMVEVRCKCCGNPFKARAVDRRRGWGKFCSKRCKAIKQERRTGQCASYHARQRNNQSNYQGSGVSRDKFLYYAEQFGGTPVFDRNGNYDGMHPDLDIGWGDSGLVPR